MIHACTCLCMCVCGILAVMTIYTCHCHTFVLFTCIQDIETAFISLLKTVNMAADYSSFVDSVTSETLLDCAKVFSTCFSSDVWIISLTIMNKVDPNSEVLKSCLCAMTDSDIDTIMFYLQKQSLLPTSDLLSLLDVAAQYGEIQNYQVIENLNSISFDEPHKHKVKAVIQTLLDATQEPHPKKSSLVEELLPQLEVHLEHFKRSVIHVDLSSREPFLKLKGLLNEMRQIVSQLEASLPCRVGPQLNDLLLSAINDLLPGVIPYMIVIAREVIMILVLTIAEDETVKCLLISIACSVIKHDICQHL